MTEKLSVIGLGKLGAPMAACFAQKGFHVVGADVNPDTVALLGRGEAPVLEPGLPEMLRSAGGRLQTTGNIADAVRQSEMSFLIVPTPSRADGEFSLEYLLAACRDVGKGLAETQEYHVVVVTSTVMPGATDGPIRAELERASGKRCGIDFGLCYSPEFIALGSVIHDLLNPDFILIGACDPRSGKLLADVYQKSCDNEPAVASMNAINAEITKIAVNTYVTTKISYANMLSEICDALPGADVDAVTDALGRDSRIGRKYLKGATGYGGPCFPRDNVAFAKLARNLGLRALIAEATDEVNRAQVPRLAGLVRSVLPRGGRVGILGLAYKPDTDVVTESQGLQLAAHLAAAQVSVTVYDPAARESARPHLAPTIKVAETAEECIADADVVVLATPWPEFLQIGRDVMERPGSPRALVDCWRSLKGRYGEGVIYIAPGLGQQKSHKE